MATRTGYGDALCQRFQQTVTCINVARGGRSSGSFRAEGLWDQVRETLRNGSQYRTTYVLIQFGHNDQPGKPGRSTDLVTEFPVNIARYVDEARSLGAVPVLVTPLTRRIFRDGELRNDLKPWADSTRRIADAKKALLLDLNADSAAAVTAMGTVEADTLAEEPPPPKQVPTEVKPADIAKSEPNGVVKSRFDYTHLGAKGAALFSRMVANELIAAVPAMATHIKPDSSAK
jgi:lysophospholipase L1-like esterase